MLRDIISGVFAFILLVAVLGGSYYAYSQMDRRVRYNEGDCLKMTFPGVEHWHNQMAARVSSVGKSSYAVRYWLEYGWSNYQDTWPFTLQMVKVECPKEQQPLLDEK